MVDWTGTKTATWYVNGVVDKTIVLLEIGERYVPIVETAISEVSSPAETSPVPEEEEEEYASDVHTTKEEEESEEEEESREEEVLSNASREQVHNSTDLDVSRATNEDNHSSTASSRELKKVDGEFHRVAQMNMTFGKK